MARRMCEEIGKDNNGENCNSCPLNPHCGMAIDLTMVETEEKAMEVVEKTEKVLEARYGQLTTARPNEKHYEGAIEPIEVMQSALTAEQFQGFCMGNIIKYSMRCGKKDDPEKELSKVRRYTRWLALSRAGKIIDPRKE